MAENKTNKKSWLSTALETAGGVGLNALTGGLGSAISGVVGDLFGGIFGKSDAEKTAEMQMQIARETNEMNYKIWQEQRQAEVDMWNMNNEYNTPEAQRQRLEDAGFSPYAMLGQGGNIGTSSSAPSTGQAPTMQQAQIPFQESRFMQGLRAMQQTTVSSLALSQAGLADSQSNRIETLLPLESDQILENINYMKKLGFTQDELKEVYRQQSENLFEQNSFLRATYADRVSQQANLTMQSRAQTTLMGLDVQERQFVSKYFEPQAWVNFATSIQNLANMAIHGQIGEKQVKLLLNQIGETYWRMMNFKQQYNINKPIETKSLFEDEALNSDAGIYYETTDENGNKKQVGGYTMKQGYQILLRKTFANSLNSSFNQSLSLSLQASELGIAGEVNKNYLKGRSFFGSFGDKSTILSDYMFKQLGYNIDRFGYVAPFLGYGKGNNRNYVRPSLSPSSPPSYPFNTDYYY